MNFRDKTVSITGQYDILEEPGEHPHSPYKLEHAAAMLIETMFYQEWIKGESDG